MEAKQAGKPAGLVSVCSAHPLVLEAAMQQALEDGLPLLVESTVNQVNQFGGYTGMRPADFAAFLDGIRSAAGLPPDRLFLGADHLGPFPWRGEPAEQAMQKACELAADSRARRLPQAAPGRQHAPGGGRAGPAGRAGPGAGRPARGRAGRRRGGRLPGRAWRSGEPGAPPRRCT